MTSKLAIAAIIVSVVTFLYIMIIWFVVSFYAETSPFYNLSAISGIILFFGGIVGLGLTKIAKNYIKEEDIKEKKFLRVSLILSIINIIIGIPLAFILSLSWVT